MCFFFFGIYDIPRSSLQSIPQYKNTTILVLYDTCSMYCTRQLIVFMHASRGLLVAYRMIIVELKSVYRYTMFSLSLRVLYIFIHIASFLRGGRQRL